MQKNKSGGGRDQAAPDTREPDFASSECINYGENIQKPLKRRTLKSGRTLGVHKIENIAAREERKDFKRPITVQP